MGPLRHAKMRRLGRNCDNSKKLFVDGQTFSLRSVRMPPLYTVGTMSGMACRASRGHYRRMHIDKRGLNIFSQNGMRTRSYISRMQSRMSTTKTKSSGTKGKFANDESHSSALVQFLSFGGQVVQFVCIMHVMQTYVFDVTMCVGPSMLPTINSAGDIVLVDRMTHRLRNLEVGDVVLAKAPSDPNQTVCKRVRGVPGDHICYSRPRTGSVEFEWSRKGITVPNGHLWLQGDNDTNSTDSRHYGPVPQGLVRGIVRCRIWPLFNAGSLQEFTWKRKTVELIDKEEEEARLHRERMAKRRQERERKRRAKAEEKKKERARKRKKIEEIVDCLPEETWQVERKELPSERNAKAKEAKKDSLSEGILDADIRKDSPHIKERENAE